MNRLPPCSTRTDTPLPYSSLFRSPATSTLTWRQSGGVLFSRVSIRRSREATSALRLPAFSRALVGDAAAITLIAMIFGSAYYALGIHFPSDRMLVDFWFQSDTPRVYSRSEEHTSELQSLMRISYAVFCLKKKIAKVAKY